MTAKSTFRGHPIHWDGAQWLFTDTNEPTVKTHQDRPCAHCGMHDTPEGHDGCLGALPGVMNACCGHGVASEAYVHQSDGSCIRGGEAIGLIDRLKEQRDGEGGVSARFGPIPDENRARPHLQKKSLIEVRFTYGNDR